MTVKRACPFCGNNNVDMMYSDRVHGLEFYCYNCSAAVHFEKIPFDRVLAEQQYNSCEKIGD